MAHRAPLSPALPDSTTIHFVLNDYGRPGRAYVETTHDGTDEASVIDNLISGQYDRPLQVIAVNLVEGWSRDVSEDVARAAFERLRAAGEEPARGTAEFMAEQLGETFARARESA